MELQDRNIIENRPTPKGNSYFIRKKNNTPIDVTLVNRTPQVNECELLSDNNQQFNDITLKSQNTSVIRNTPNMLSHTEDTLNRYNNSKNSLKNLNSAFIIGDSTIKKYMIIYLHMFQPSRSERDTPVLRSHLSFSRLISKSPVLRETCPNFEFFIKILICIASYLSFGVLTA